MSIDVSKMPKLGFGLMRLPQKDGEIDIPQLSQMVDMYMEKGFNYFDTAYVYHGGKSETAIREALVKRYPRDSYMLATKMPIWVLDSAEGLDRVFDEQLERTGVEYFDLYLLHSIDDTRIAMYEKFDAFNWGLKKKEEGKIRHLGFSYHGSPECLETILDNHPEIEFVQIQFNYADLENPLVHSRRLYEIVSSRGIPMVIMEPVKGGSLANLPEKLAAKFKAARPDKSIASWALRYVASHDGVMTILSGMSAPEHMEDNLNTFVSFEPLSESEFALVHEVADDLYHADLVACTDCRYCVDGCPSGILIPDVFKAINVLRQQGGNRPQLFYNGLVGRSGRAGDCIGCGQCESVCPQHLPIIELLKEASGKFDSKR